MEVLCDRAGPVAAACTHPIDRRAILQRVSAPVCTILVAFLDGNPEKLKKGIHRVQVVGTLHELDKVLRG